MSGVLQEPTSIWDNIISKRNTLLSFFYKGQHLSVWRHRNPQSEMDEYYVTPVPQLIPSTIQCQESILADSSKLVFQVEMWSHSIQDATINAIQEHLGLQPTRLQVHPLPFQKIRLTHRSGHGRADAAIRLDSTWLPNTQEKFQHKFFFWAENPEVCSTEKEKIMANPESLADELLLEALLTAEAHSSKELSVQSHHITKSKLFASLNSMDTQGTIRYLRAEDVNKMAQQIASKVIATEISDVDFVPAEDELSLKELINGQLKAAKETTDTFTRDQWESVFWEPTFAQPDKITDFLQNTMSFDQGTQKFTCDENKAKEWAQSNKTDLKKMSKHFNHQDSDARKDISGSAAVKLPGTAGLFDMSGTGALKDTEKKKSTSKTRTSESDLKEDSDKGKDSVQLSEDQMDSWLQKNNLGVRVQGEMFQPKPMDLWRLNLRDLEQKEELLTKRVQVRRINVETSFQVGIKGDKAMEAEEAEAMRKMLAETKAELAELKSCSVSMNEELKIKLDEKVSELNSSAAATNAEIVQLRTKLTEITAKLSSGSTSMKEEVAGIKLKLDEKTSELSGEAVSRKTEINDLVMKLTNQEMQAAMAIQGLKCTYYSILLIGGKEESKTSAEWFYPWNPIRNRKFSLPNPRNGQISAVLDSSGAVLVAGGHDGKNCLTSAVLLDPITESWTMVQSMGSKRDTAGAVVVDGVVYICGGWDGSKDLRTCERYRNGEWEDVAPMYRARAALQVVALDQKLYAIGGDEGNTALSLLEVYDIQTDTWTQKASMPTAQKFFGAAVLGKSIIVCGGTQGNGRECLKYDVEDDKWSSIAPMNQRRNEFTVVAFGDHLVALGGEDDEAKFTAEIYDPDKDQWTMVNAKFYQKRYRHSAVAFMPDFRSL